jgi:putative transposase
MLSDKKNAWESSQKNLTAFDLIKTIPLRKSENQDLKLVYADVLQNLGLRLDKAFKGFFSRVKCGEKPGYPRFKGKGRFRSMIFPKWNSGIKLYNNKLKISKIGLIKIKLHRNFIGNPKNAIISKSGDDWYVSILCEGDHSNILPKTNQVAGIDLGIKKFIQVSDGSIIENPRFFEQDQKALAKQQKKKKFKAVKKIHKRITNKRIDFIHKTANKLLNKYDIIFIENLNVNKMLIKKWCSKQISDVAWTLFINTLSYKAENAGKKIVKVNPAYTSQTCSECHTATPHKLQDEIFNCKSCGYADDRDFNASKNIKTLGLQGLA